jgi:hypothetical protein
MKKLLFIIALFVAVSATGQDQYYSLRIDSLTNEASYSEVIVTNLSKDVMFKKVQTWVAKNFNEYKVVVKLENMDAGRIILKPVWTYYYSDWIQEYVYSTITIDIKEGRYRYSITDIYDEMSVKSEKEPTIRTFEYDLLFVANHESDPKRKVSIQEHVSKVNSYYADMIVSLKKEMNTNDEF